MNHKHPTQRFPNFFSLYPPLGKRFEATMKEIAESELKNVWTKKYSRQKAELILRPLYETAYTVLRSLSEPPCEDMVCSIWGDKPYLVDIAENPRQDLLALAKTSRHKALQPRQYIGAALMYKGIPQALISDPNTVRIHMVDT